MAWLDFDPYDVPECLERTRFDCSVCEFFEQASCPLYRDGELRSFKRQEVRLRRQAQAKRDALTQLLAFELAAHGLPLHYTRLAEIVRGRYEFAKITNFDVYNCLNGFDVYFKAEGDGVYGLTPLGRSMASQATATKS